MEMVINNVFFRYVNIVGRVKFHVLCSVQLLVCRRLLDRKKITIFKNNAKQNI